MATAAREQDVGLLPGMEPLGLVEPLDEAMVAGIDRYEVLDGVTADGLRVMPAGAPRALVIALPDAAWTREPVPAAPVGPAAADVRHARQFHELVSFTQRILETCSRERARL